MRLPTISPRAVAITGILVVLICVGTYLYMHQEAKNFQARLSTVSTQVVDIPGAAGVSAAAVPDDGFSESIRPETPAQTVPATTEAPVAEMCATEDIPACEMEDMTAPESRHYARMTVPEVRALLRELANPNVEDLEGKLSQLEQVLINRLGPDPKIPKAIDALSAAYALIEFGEKANAVGVGGSEARQTFLDHAPAVVLETLVETSIELLQPSESEAARARAIVENFRGKIDTLKFYQDMAPLVETAIENGELSPAEGAAFLESLGEDVSVQVDPDVFEVGRVGEERPPSEPPETAW